MAKELQVVSTKVPPSIYEEIEEEIETSEYINVSDFVRQAIREKIENGEQNG